MNFWKASFSNFSNSKEIGKKITQKSNDKNATNHIIQAISMAVQRGNAASIIGTLGPQRKLDDYFDILVQKTDKDWAHCVNPWKKEIHSNVNLVI